jgi:hypothetical protein
MDRRERLIKFIEPWIEGRPAQYAPRIGSDHLGYQIVADDLDDAALEVLAKRIIWDFWYERRINRRNRALRRAAS